MGITRSMLQVYRPDGALGSYKEYLDGSWQTRRRDIYCDVVFNATFHVSACHLLR